MQKGLFVASFLIDFFYLCIPRITCTNQTSNHYGLHYLDLVYLNYSGPSTKSLHAVEFSSFSKLHRELSAVCSLVLQPRSKTWHTYPGGMSSEQNKTNVTS